MFGRLTLAYTRRYIYSELPPKENEPPYRQRIPYRVLASDASSVTISTADTTMKIHFIGPNRYWIPLGTKGVREYFDRIDR